MPRRYGALILAAIVWSALCAVSTVAFERLSAKRVDELARQHARAVHQTVVDFRTWNTAHGGVYVDQTPETQANPYLPETMGSRKGKDGETLVLIVPAHMTRRVGEISMKRDGPGIRITSLNPLRPENAPLAWEREALEIFKDGGHDEFDQFTSVADVPRFHYAAPLLTAEPCLRCHAAQGYEVGEIRGAVTVDLPAQGYLAAKTSNRQSVFGLGSLSWVLGMVTLALLGRAARSRQRMIERLEDLSLRDPLTGLTNRRGFRIRAEQAFSTLAREKGEAVLAFADLDGLKIINDSLGHPRGDEALSRIGEHLKRAFRGNDVVARIGGDEFVVLFVDGALVARECLERRIQDAIDLANQTWEGPPLSLSVGMVSVDCAGPGRPDIDALIDTADESMYQQKRRRRATTG